MNMENNIIIDMVVSKRNKSVKKVKKGINNHKRNGTKKLNNNKQRTQKGGVKAQHIRFELDEIFN